ncbi:DEAD/DEAH box helicase [Schlesneria sp. DSM 10557]|uniref:DEAD/DEAH box helicase n=1 Tax=Schlesneria sp. DSM 10557 TaxID=3044399 RepID=UPI0035A0E478
MHSNRGALAKSASDDVPAKSAVRDEAAQQILDQIQTLIRRHSRRAEKAGSRWVGRIAGPTYDPEISFFYFECSVRGVMRALVLVKQESTKDNQSRLIPSCSCENFNGLFCEHTFAALTVLLQKLSEPGSAMLKEVLNSSKPVWSVALRNLDQFLHAADAPKPQVPSVPRSRLAWRLMIGPYSTLTMEPVEQTPSKRGGWNKGRAIDWDQLHYDTSIELLPADLEVLQASRSSRFAYWLPTTDQIGTLCEKLVGHPQVFFETTKMEVVKGQLGLRIEEKGENWELIPSISGREVSQFAHFYPCNHICGIAIDMDAAQIHVIRAEVELWKLILSLFEHSPAIPPEAQPHFLQRLPALEAKLPVGLPVSLKGELVDAQQRLFLRVTPHALVGATIQLEVQPAPEGPYFTPGEGPDEVAGLIEEKRVQVQRDPAAERRDAQQLANDLFLNRFTAQGLFHWQVATDDDVLDLLDALRSRPEGDPTVLWPEDSQRQMNVVGEITPAALRVEIKDHHDWFGLSGSITLGGQQFPLATLLTALRGGRRYLDLGKGQFAVISKEFRDRLANLADMVHSNRGKLEINATAAPLLSDVLDDQVTLKASKKWKESLKRLHLATNLEPVVPSTLQADLRDYQVEGYKWLRRLAEWGVGGCLADDMGLGKTVQTVAVLLDRREKGPTLIVAPVSVGFNWMREVERFAPTLRPILYRDTDRVDFLKTLTKGDLLITSYHLLQQHVSELSTIQWGTLVLDEAQAVKNSQTKTAAAVREIQADWKLALTGTPAENHLGDLWSVFRAVSPGLFGSWERFRDVFAEPIEKSKDPERKQALSRVIRPFILRRTKSEVLSELPARTEIQLTAELSPEERRIYEDARLWAVKNLTNLIDGAEKDQRFVVLAALTRLRQLACHPRLVDKKWKHSSAKLDLFLETVEELREGRHRALVFSQFTQHLALVREALDLRKIEYQYLDGSTPAKKRQQAVEAFQRGEGELFLISLKAGGTGLNLTAADYVLHLDPWWNPAVEDQATDRAHRIGQTRPVTVYRFVSKETIEEQILKLHADKRGLVAGILEGTDAAAKMSTAELVDLIRLGGSST